MKKYRPVSFRDVEISGGFWQERQRVNRESTLGVLERDYTATGRFGAIRCEWREGMPNRPHIFWDSDVAKWIQGAAYILQKRPDPALEKRVEAVIGDLIAQQTRDGYINSYFNGVEPAKRWSGRGNHELYCAGHLIEAAVAWKHAVGSSRFLSAMCRYADHICDVFTSGSAAFDTPGHEEIELALIALWQETREKHYLDMALRFIEMRGRSGRDFPEDAPMSERASTQSHAPVRDQKSAEGHAVRACYLYAAMADAARETDDESLKAACRTLWESITRRRMYVTGGIGSSHVEECFTADYDLPNDTAYSETCASIALALFARRMQQIDLSRDYADVIERVLYNSYQCAASLDGSTFFYCDPLSIDTLRRNVHPSFEKGDWLPRSTRTTSYACSCCPPNILRFTASVGDFAFTCDDDAVYIHQFMDVAASFDGCEIRMCTDYPASGLVRVSARMLFGRKIAVRIPSWCSSFALSVPYTLRDGYAYVDGAGEFTLEMDMSPFLVTASGSVSDAAFKACVMRGPVVYAAEAIDNPSPLHALAIGQSPAFTLLSPEAYGVPRLACDGYLIPPDGGDGPLYRRGPAPLDTARLRFVPYFSVANRGECDMRVWLPLRY